MKMRIENHTHIRYIMLYHFEKGSNAAQSFRDLNELLAKEQQAKAKLNGGSNRAIQTSQMKNEEVGHQISATRHFWQPWKRTKAGQPECWPKTSM